MSNDADFTVCFKFVKHIAMPSYMEYMLYMPLTVKPTPKNITAQVILRDDPERGYTQLFSEKNMTVEMYQKWLRLIVGYLDDDMPETVKRDYIKHQQHLL